MGLKLRATDQKVWIGGKRARGATVVIDGEPLAPGDLYELPPDPAGDAVQMQRMQDDRERRRESERTMFTRAMRAVVGRLRNAKGRGFEIRLLRWCVLEFHRIPTHGYGQRGELFRLELYRWGRWDLNVELWRRRKHGQ